jgi:hypothetical protein
MLVSCRIQTIAGFLLVMILANGCGDASKQKSTSSNTQAPADAKTAGDHPSGPSAKDGATASDGNRDQKTPLPPTVYSALELAKIVDFTKLKTPKDATRAGCTLSCSLEMNVPSKVPEAAAFYIDQLKALGWKVDDSAKTINNSEAAVRLTKNGHVIFLGAFPMDEKKPESMVSLYFHGNFDTQTLPRSEGAKLLYGSQSQTIFTTPNKVPAEAEWIEKTLKGQGWQRYIRAKASELKSDEEKHMDFRKQGYALNVFVSKASDPGYAASVQYGVHAIAHELPAPLDATDVEFDDAAWTLHCELPTTMEAGVAFYRQAMAAAGYKELSGEKPQEKYINLRFGTEAGDVIPVQVAKKDDKTCKISIYGVSAEMMEKIRKEDEKRTKQGK